MDNGESGRGKHRLDDSAATWLPSGGELDHVASTHSRPTIAPDDFPIQRGRPPVDPFADTGGLRKFNIGLVPASVTPPRTWKRAAWFAVLSSAGVLVGLAIAAAKLVGNTGPVERIGMPGYPIDVPLLTGLPTKESRPPTSSLGLPPVRQVPDGVQSSGDQPLESGGAESTSSGPGTSTHPSVSGTTPPQVTTVPNRETPVVDGSAIAARTEKFYEELATNSDTAMAMATETFRSTSEAVLEQRFADVSLIEVKEISVDPAKGITISLLQVTKKDGSTSTEKRELTFTTVGDLLVDAERLTGVG
jgi:hypothetical protein